MTKKHHHKHRRNPPHATIDLKATEIEEADAADADDTTLSTGSAALAGKDDHKQDDNFVTDDEPRENRTPFRQEDDGAADQETKLTAGGELGSAQHQTADNTIKGKIEENSGNERESAKGGSAGGIGNDGQDNHPTGAEQSQHIAARSDNMSGNGWFGTLLAAIAGGVIALLGSWMFAGGDDTARSTAVDKSLAGAENRLAEIETAVTGLKTQAQKQAAIASALPKQVTGRVEELEKSLATLQQGQSALDTQAKTLAEQIGLGADRETVDAVGKRVSLLEDNLKSMKKLADRGGDTVGQAAALAEKLKEVENQLEARLGETTEALRQEFNSSVSTSAAGFHKNLTAVQQQVTDLPNAQSVDAIKTGVDTLSRDFGGQMEEFRTKLQTQREDAVKLSEAQASVRENLAKLHEEQVKLRTDTAALRDDVAKLHTTLTDLGTKVAQSPDVNAQIAPFGERIAAIESQLKTVQETNESARQEGRNVALAVMLSNLKKAVSGGAPYADALAQIRPYVPAEMDLSALEKHAGQGLPTVATLKQQLPKIVSEILDTEAAAKSDSLVDQLMSNAKSFVRVRPTGMVEGDSASAVASRLEHKVMTQNDLDGALKETEGLQGPALKAAQPWIDKAKARLGGAAALNALEAKIISMLSSAAATQ